MSTQTATVVIAPYGIAPSGTPYPPHPTQKKLREWVRAITDQDPQSKSTRPGIPTLYLQHGVDAGGTRAVLAPIVKRLIEEPGIRVLIGRKDFNDLRLSVLETFLSIIPPELIARHNDQEHRYEIQGANGIGTVFFRELKDVRGLGSQEFAAVVVCEVHEIGLPAYRTLKQRLRQPGYPLMMLMEGNPPMIGHWLDGLTNPHDKDFDPSLENWQLTSYENWPFMNQAYRETLEQMPAAWRERFIMAKTGALPSGKPVYPSFISSLHSRQTWILPDRPVYRGWDFGFRRAACVWGQLTDDKRLLIQHEWMPFETPEDDFIKGVLVRTKEWYGDRAYQDAGDPAARNRDPQGIATLTRLKENYISLHYRNSTYAERIPLINSLFSRLTLNQATVVIDPSCTILSEAIAGGYHFPEAKEGRLWTHVMEVPEKEGYYEHLANAFEYLALHLFGKFTASDEKLRQARDRRKRMIEDRKMTAVF